MPWYARSFRRSSLDGGSSVATNSSGGNQTKRNRSILRWVVIAVLGVSCSLLSARMLPPPPPSVVNTNQQDESQQQQQQQQNSQKPKPIWNWEHYHHRWHSFGRPSLLIGHYASQTEGDAYRDMMKESVKSSRAYCRRWRCDVVTLEGTLFAHPTHNKVGLLDAAMGRGYSRLLLLDADCVVVNHTVDIATQLIPRDKMVMAQHVWGHLDREPWNTNIGVTLWNLQHPQLPSFAKRWRERCETDKTDNDQWHYHILMRGKENEPRKFEDYQLSSIDDYFRYRNATVVKHFLRDDGQWWGPPDPKRMDSIRAEVALVCQNNTFC